MYSFLAVGNQSWAQPSRGPLRQLDRDFEKKKLEIRFIPQKKNKQTKQNKQTNKQKKTNKQKQSKKINKKQKKKNVCRWVLAKSWPLCIGEYQKCESSLTMYVFDGIYWISIFFRNWYPHRRVDVCTCIAVRIHAVRMWVYPLTDGASEFHADKISCWLFLGQVLRLSWRWVLTRIQH